MTRAERWSVALDETFVGSLVGELKVVGFLGEGETCCIYEAWDPAGAQRTVRVFKPELAATPAFFARLDGLSQKLVGQRHTGIASHLGVGTLDDGQPYAVMEFLDGEPLAAWLGRHPQPTIDEVVKFGIGLCAVLQPLHAARLAHGTITPGHVFLRGNDPLRAPMLTSLGMPRAARPRSDAYLAPEQRTGGPTTPSTDLYALGLCLYRMLTGRDPFANGAAREPVPDPARARPDAPKELSALIQTLLAVAPTARPASAEGVSQALAAVLAPKAKATTAPAPDASPFHTTAEILAQQQAPRPAPRAPRPIDATEEVEPESRRRPSARVVALAVAAIAAVAVGVAFLARSPAPEGPAPAPVAPPLVAARPPPPAVVAPPPEPVGRATPSVRELLARAKTLAQELKRRPETTYTARTELRALTRRAEATPDATERAAIAADLDLWEQTYLPGR